MNFSERLADLMRKKGVNWKTISEELHIGLNQKRKWETKNSVPDGKTLIKLAEYFEVSAEYLLTGKEETPTTEKNAGDFYKMYNMLTAEERGELNDHLFEILRRHMQD